MSDDEGNFSFEKMMQGFGILRREMAKGTEDNFSYLAKRHKEIIRILATGVDSPEDALLMHRCMQQISAQLSIRFPEALPTDDETLSLLAQSASLKDTGLVELIKKIRDAKEVMRKAVSGDSDPDALKAALAKAMSEVTDRKTGVINMSALPAGLLAKLENSEPLSEDDMPPELKVILAKLQETLGPGAPLVVHKVEPGSDLDLSELENKAAAELEKLVEGKDDDEDQSPPDKPEWHKLN